LLPPSAFSLTTFNLNSYLFGVNYMAESRTNSELTRKVMSDSDFDRLSEFISAHCGIKMPRGKKVMLEARLGKRLRSVGAASFHDYCDYLFNAEDGEKELVHMIEAVTTHKTDFFREPVHFDFLVETILPEYINSSNAGRGNLFRVWSAGCSSGEEPYTLAMVLSEFASQSRSFFFSILATDISTQILDKARRGIYEEDRIVTVPMSLKKRYIMRSKDPAKGVIRMAPELRSIIRFEKLNLMDEKYDLKELPLDVIFCRNVIIYFDRLTQERLINRFCRYLKPNGYLILGHSESMHGLDVPLNRVSSTIYRKTS
jgi:chemotaxis protein methyltransferase CheR